MRFIASLVDVFRVNVLFAMNQPRIDIFKMIRLLSNESDVINANMTTLKQTDGLLFARIACRIGRFRFGMILILTKNIPVCLHACRVIGTDQAICRDAIGVSRVLVNPFDFEPSSRIVVINEMKMFRVGALWVSERLDVTG